MPIIDEWALRGVLSKQKKIIIRFGGGSMYPTIRHNDRLLIEPIENLETGQIYVYVIGGKAIAHRLIGFEAGQLKFRGDNMDGADPFVNPTRLLGKVTEIKRGKKLISPTVKPYLYYWLQRRVVRVLVRLKQVKIK